ncbi:MAG TPA: four helix bundle protein [Cytophagales bacterium]|nr:four helix bundle protein [Cytophagales bacterium]
MEKPLETKSLDFAVRVVKLCQFLGREKKEYTLAKQLLRSGTAIGALYREAQYAESKKDFVHKLHIGLKEANETLYWLELLHRAEYLNEAQYKSMHADAQELVKLLISAIKTAKKNMNS